ncbi:hypothetical protein SAMN04515692_10168 [Leifsonia sp. CL147]|nr:hypothetical protein SAMN04515692_10168 [Leifsonia sp. CL147]
MCTHTRRKRRFVTNVHLHAKEAAIRHECRRSVPRNAARVGGLAYRDAVSASWHPVANAQPSEWLLRQGSLGAPYGVIRRFAFGDPNNPDVWFRVVTWAQSSAERELIGWCRTLEAAAAAAWDHRRATESWRHHLASRRVDAAGMAAQSPSAADLVQFYRAALRRDASTASTSSPMPPTRPARPR